MTLTVLHGQIYKLDDDAVIKMKIEDDNKFRTVINELVVSFVAMKSVAS